jgi:hypothetical protein
MKFAMGAKQYQTAPHSRNQALFAQSYAAIAESSWGHLPDKLT